MSENKRILIIDDEKNIRDALKISFDKQLYLIEEAETGQKGLEKVKTFHPNLIILDLGLPDIDGYHVLKELRTWTTVPVIILTVNDDEDTKVKLLDSGADDFLSKPFSSAELQARIRVALRHNGNIEATPVFISSDLKVNLNTRQVEVNDLEIKLTNTEFEVLQRLVREAGKVVSQNKLLKEIWGATAKDETHYLRIYIKQLRKKIEKNPAMPIHIITEPGVGYKII